MASGVAVASSSATLCVGIAPSISGFDPMIGAANTSVTIFGTALGQASGAIQRGGPASFIAANDGPGRRRIGHGHRLRGAVQRQHRPLPDAHRQQQRDQRGRPQSDRRIFARSTPTRTTPRPCASARCERLGASTPGLARLAPQAPILFTVGFS
jgi:hypothetical protein